MRTTSSMSLYRGIALVGGMVTSWRFLALLRSRPIDSLRSFPSILREASSSGILQTER